VIRDAGERALLVELPSPLAAQALAVDLQRDRPAGVAAIVPGFRSVLVELDAAGLSSAGELRDELIARAGRLPGDRVVGRRRTIPVVYGGEHGPDLGAAAAALGLAPAELVRRHAAAELPVLFCGFAPGFAYIGELPPELRLPRLDTPRTHTPPGSVAIAGAMTGIYPADLPGGWRVIGRTPILLFDSRRDPPAYLAPGDRVRFVPVPRESIDWTAGARAADDW
jgi:KipI family sensor histidine kinase inhibitor